MPNYLLKDNDTILDSGRQYTLRLRDLPDYDRPREKMINNGIDSLSAADLLSIVINTGTKKEDVSRMSKRILKEYGEKAIISERNPKNLARELSIPIVKACQIVATFELGRRFFDNAESRPKYVRNAKQAFTYLKDMNNLPKEHLRGLYLSSRYQVIHEEIISIGSLTANIIHPREVFMPALRYSAAAIIIAHNHPSGNVNPTRSDIEITRSLMEAGKLLGIDLLDHIIIAKNSFISIIEKELTNEK